MARKDRNYAKEAKAAARPDRVKDRMSRNRARAAAIRAGKARKGDGKEVDHKNMNPRDNRPSNLQVIPRSQNRRKQPKRK
jgi:predicted transcriptional regulator